MKNRDNPIIRTAGTIAFWCLLLIVLGIILPSEGGSETFLGVILIIFYTAPIVGILSFGIYLLINRKWYTENKVAVWITCVILLVWLLALLPDIIEKVQILCR